MADIYATVVEGTTVGANSRRILGDGTSGVGPYTRFGTPQLQALKIISSNYNFTTTPTVSNSNLSKAVRALQELAEIYYVGVPTASGANQFIALVNLNTAFNGNTQGAGSTEASADGTYTALEADILAALGGVGSVTITNSTLTGLSFN